MVLRADAEDVITRDDESTSRLLLLSIKNCGIIKRRRCDDTRHLDYALSAF
jgi:hypothetical protein